MTHQYDSSRIESDLHSLQQGTSEDGMGWDGMGWDGGMLVLNTPPRRLYYVMLASRGGVLLLPGFGSSFMLTCACCSVNCVTLTPKAGTVGDLIVRSHNGHEKRTSSSLPSFKVPNASRVARKEALLARFNSKLHPPLHARINGANHNDEVVVKAAMLREWLAGKQAASWFG